MNRVWAESCLHNGMTSVQITLSHGVKISISAQHDVVTDFRRKKPFGYDMSATTISIQVGHSATLVMFDALCLDSMEIRYPWYEHPLMPSGVADLIAAGLLPEVDRAMFLTACGQAAQKLRLQMERLLGA